MSERSSLSCVVGVVGHGESRDADHRFNRAYVDGILVEVWMPHAVAVDVFPCLNGVEVEFVWGDANDGAVFVVQELIFECDATF